MARSRSGARARTLVRGNYATVSLSGFADSAWALNKYGYASVGASGFGTATVSVFRTDLPPIYSGRLGGPSSGGLGGAEGGALGGPVSGTVEEVFEEVTA